MQIFHNRDIINYVYSQERKQKNCWRFCKMDRDRILLIPLAFAAGLLFIVTMNNGSPSQSEVSNPPIESIQPAQSQSKDVTLNEIEGVPQEEEKDNYTKGFEFSEKIQLVLAEAKKKRVSNQITEAEFDKLLDLYGNVQNSINENRTNLEKNLQEFNSFSTELMGDNFYTAPETQFDAQGFYDAEIFYLYIDLAKDSADLNSISEAEYLRIQKMYEETRKDITHDKVSELLTYLQDVL